MIGIADSAANLFDILGRGVADLTRVPSAVIDEGPQRRVHRYRGPRRHKARHPVLLVPPLAAPASCFDLRTGKVSGPPAKTPVRTHRVLVQDGMVYVQPGAAADGAA